MPENMHEDFDSSEVEEQKNTQSDEQSTPAQPTRRRGSRGRRVVRGAGAADADVAMKIEDHNVPQESTADSSNDSAKESATEPAKEAPALPAAREHAALPSGSADEEQPTRRRRRRSALQEADEATHTHRRGSRAMQDADDDDELPRRRGSRASQRTEDNDEAPRRRSRRTMTDESNSASDDRDAAQDQPRRRRRRMVHVDEDPFLEPVPRRNSQRSSQDDDSRGRVSEAVDSIDDFATVPPARPMTSLLFQEPVLPAVSAPSTDRNTDSDDHEHEEVAEETTHRRRRSRRRHSEDHDETSSNERHESQDDEQENTEEQPRRHRNRRLNAEERRAAAEVEQIEEDLALDDITYAPIDDESKKDKDAEDDEQPTRTRRRRRRKSADSQNAENDEDKQDESQHQHSSADEEDEGTTVRRRRRRRKSADTSEEETPRRSRKQQYIDEITDVEGSTRLEAKKQRRRDNRRERSRQNQLLEQDFLARREHVDRLMVVRQSGRHTQISVIEDNILVEHYVSDIQEVATVGNIYLGRVQNVLPSMEAAFVDIGQARNGVLYAGEVNWDTTRLEGQPRRIELAFRSGDPVLVQVTKDPIGHKGARLTSQVTLAGRFLVLVPSGGMTGVSRKLSDRERSRLKSIVAKIAPKDMGVIIRTAAEGASQEAITKDLENLTRQWEQIQAKKEEFLHGKRPKLLQGEPDVAIRVVRDIFNDDFRKLIVEGDGVYERIADYLDTMAPDLREKLEKWDPAEHDGKDVFDKWQIDSQLRKGMERQVYLPSGGSIVIDRTEAMTTIDVNTGRFIGKGRSLEETVTRCNLEAAEEIARQLRLRDIGGMVMIDFVDMVMPANRDLVLRRLVECLSRDRTKHQVAEVTSLGLVQMTRKRIGQGLVEAFSEECPTCKGRGFIVHDEPTVSSDYADPYALKGGDPFVKTNKHGHGTDANVPKGSSAEVRAKLAQIAAAAAANDESDDSDDSTDMDSEE